MPPQHQYHAITIQSLDAEPVRIAYQDHQPSPSSPSSPPKPPILLLHGFPQTSNQYRHILPLLASAGHRSIAPDYRGAGLSSTSHTDFRKTTMALDMLALLDALAITEPVHVLGHDIGGMVAFALASRHPSRVRSVCWGECPLPGTEAYQRSKTEDAVQFFHFVFHAVADLPEALVAGRERVYVEHFLRKITFNHAAFGEADVEFYGQAYARPGAMRCAFGVYRAFEKDAEENREWVEREGRGKVASLVVSGEKSRHRAEARGMVEEVTEREVIEEGVVMGAEHYLAEENPEGFVEVVLPFFEAH